MKNKRYYWLVAICSAIVLLLPIILGNFQFITGSIVNCAIIFGAINFQRFALLPIIILPSIGMFIGSLVLGVFFPSLLYVMPFIWAGNGILVLLFKWLELKKSLSFFLVLGLSGIAKSIILFVPSVFLYNMGDIAKPALTRMSFLPLLTVIIGGILAYLILYKCGNQKRN